MEEPQSRLYRASSASLVTGLMVYGIALGTCLLMLDRYAWVAALVVTFFNVPLLGGEWLRMSQSWQLLDGNGITVSTPHDFRTVAWQEADSIVRVPSHERRATYEYRVVSRGRLGLRFDDSILSADEAAEIIESCIEQQRALEREPTILIGSPKKEGRSNDQPSPELLT